MRIGMNLLLWTTEVTDAHLPLFERLREIGYEGIEVPIFAPEEQKYARLGRQLDDLGLARTAVTLRTGDENPISRDAAMRRQAAAATNATLDSCAALGSKLLAGPYHSALGVFSGAAPTAEEWQWAVDGIRQVAEHAEQYDITLAIEYLNRFESYLMTSAAETARFVREVGHPLCRMMIDTFHCHIEEKNVARSVEDCADVLTHIHVSENDRSTPGQGNFRWDALFGALKRINYDGWLMVEAFGNSHPEIAAATKIWRPMFESEDQLARDAFAFVGAAVGGSAYR